MRTFVVFILLVSGVGDLFAAPVEWTDEKRRIEAEQVALWESKLAEAQGKPPAARPADLWLGLKNMWHRRQNYDGHSPAVDAIYLNIQEELLSIPNHARYFADKIKHEQSSVSQYPMNTGPRVAYDFHRYQYFKTLRHLPSPETISVLGEFLSDDIDTPTVRISPDSDWGENPRANSYHSSWTVMNIGLRNPPVGEEDKKVNVDERLAKTRAWWEEIKSGNRTFSFIRQKVEYRFKPDGMWETIAMLNPPNDAAKPAASAARLEKHPPPQETKKGIPPQRLTLVWLLGAAALLSAVGWLVWRKSQLRAE